ncbi:hypothetical protein [Capnocytophaga sp.]|uniref:hypothetical protein n=1 Tax=Capnocytophaga sp. TaxID=44737 RepID=UPI0026DBE9BD|nr:hypothetical protein [Capnocytophaga sp.]MDO5105239.1 hypothetical protein [Capnocytophaga sp.]
MKKISIALLLLSPLWAMAQTDNVQGIYHSGTLGNDFKLKLNDDGTFELLLFTGKYTSESGGKVQFSPDKIPSFIVEEKQKGTTDSLQINFKSGYNLSELAFFYLGYEQNGEVKYVNLAEEITPANNDLPVKTQNGELVYELGDFQIPKTANLYLVNALSSSPLNSGKTEKSVTVEKYPIGNDVRSVDVFFSLSGLYSIHTKATGLYNPEKESLYINDFFGSNAVSLYKNTPENNKKTIKNTDIQEIKNWKHLKFFDNEYDYQTSDSTTMAVETRIKLEVKNSLSEALKSAKKSNKPLLVFYQPEQTQQAKEAFSQLLKNYETELRYYTYDLETYDLVDFYFADKKDEKWLRKKSISPKNQLVLLSGTGDVLYHEANPMETLTEKISPANDFLKALVGIYSAKKTDDILSDKKAGIQELENAFFTLLNAEIPYAAYHFSAEEKTQNDENQDNYDADYWAYYLNSLSNKESVYKSKTTPEQAEKQWKKMVEAHQNDTKLSVTYAVVLSKNYQAYDDQTYGKKMFGKAKPMNNTDLKAIRYLLKHNDAIVEHNNNINYDEISAYKHEINFYPYEVSAMLNQAAADSPDLRPLIKQIYQEEQQKNLSLYTEFEAFLKEYYPQEYLSHFSDYYQKMVSAEPSNIILSLDKMYPLYKSDYNEWSYYKKSFANNCNNAAWNVVESHSSDTKWLTEAIKWVETALEVDTDSPYILDTYAHLLYYSGNKAEAIEKQQKAVKIITNDPQTYNQGTEDEIKETLTKMQNGTL